MRFLFLLICSLCLCVSNAWASREVLSKSDVRNYKQIFTLQGKGDFAAVKEVEKKIEDNLLRGYVLSHRYFSKKYTTKPDEIYAWMAQYADLPVAVDVYALGNQKKIKHLMRPKGLFGGNTQACASPGRQEPLELITNLSFSYLSGARKREAVQKMNRIVRALKQGQTLNARQILQDKKTVRLFDREDLNKAKTALAYSYLLDGEDDLALTTIKETIMWKINTVPLSYWVAGLASWSLGDLEEAATYFSNLADVKSAPDTIKARAAYWAARAYLGIGQYDSVMKYLKIAEKSPRNFYGMLASRALGENLNYVWDTPVLAADEVRASFSHPALERFYALKQIGQNEWASQELSKLYLEADDEGKGVLMLISKENGFDDVLQGLTGTLQGEEVRYPMPNWTPQGGWKLKKELVYAFVRQESCFNNRAESHAGALGLMQLMPDTAKELASVLQCPFSKSALKDPAYNLRLGQAYLMRLMEEYPQVNNNLMFLAVAYNAGPGNLIKWKSKMRQHNDPLLFLETLPSRETRGFVERILVNYWVYQNLMGKSLESMDEIIQKRWPLYQRH